MGGFSSSSGTAPDTPWPAGAESAATEAPAGLAAAGLGAGPGPAPLPVGRLASGRLPLAHCPAQVVGNPSMVRPLPSAMPPRPDPAGRPVTLSLVGTATRVW